MDDGDVDNCSNAADDRAKTLRDDLLLPATTDSRPINCSTPAPAMASKLTPLLRTAVRSACRTPRPQQPQFRALSLSAQRRSDTLMVVSANRSPSHGTPPS